MTQLRLFITALILFAALFSVQANAVDGNNDVVQKNNVNVMSVLDNTPDSIINSYLSVSKSAFVKNSVKKQPEDLGFKALQPRLTANNSSLFLYQRQVEPNYETIFEFFAPSLARELYLRPLEPPIISPWFIVYEGKKSRISGWKDANLQYSATRTYHI
ncbi:hypothetical protein [Pseudoalteromonas sp. Ld20]|uniref:hypothetical protein n=1 Tax=Pseudoalteromonas sp. Ld20 TaxID=649165 RepID=UPI003869C9E9